LAPLLEPPVVFIAGPTASGKSAAAVALAERIGGDIINADSMQLYDELRILTARPGAAELARAPHYLYGVLPAARPCSVARWREMALARLAQSRRAGRVPIITGGTGLYFRSLIDGLAPVPDIPPAVRAAARRREGERPGALHDELRVRDPIMAARLAPGDSQRVARAWEVVEATGVSLADWQSRTIPGPLAADNAAGRIAKLVFMPPRAGLYKRIEARFEAMMAAGALNEARALLAAGLDPGLPAMKALGLPALIGHLRGEHSLEEAVAAAKGATRRYAKRQYTWFSHQCEGWHFSNAQDSESFLQEIFPIIQKMVLTE